MKGNIQKKIFNVIKVLALIIPLAYIIACVVAFQQSQTYMDITQVTSDITSYIDDIYLMLPSYLTNVHEIIYNAFDFTKNGFGYAVSKLIFSEMCYLFVLEVIEMCFNLVTFLFRKANDFLGGVN